MYMHSHIIVKGLIIKSKLVNYHGMTINSSIRQSGLKSNHGNELLIRINTITVAPSSSLSQTFTSPEQS